MCATASSMSHGTRISKNWQEKLYISLLQVAKTKSPRSKIITCRKNKNTHTHTHTHKNQKETRSHFGGRLGKTNTTKSPVQVLNIDLYIHNLIIYIYIYILTPHTFPKPYPNRKSKTKERTYIIYNGKCCLAFKSSHPGRSWRPGTLSFSSFLLTYWCWALTNLKRFSQASDTETAQDFSTWLSWLMTSNVQETSGKHMKNCVRDTKLEAIHLNSDCSTSPFHPPASVHQRLGRICTAAIHLQPDPNLKNVIHRCCSVCWEAASTRDPRTTAAMMVAPSILRPREINPLRMAKLVAHEIQVALGGWLQGEKRLQEISWLHFWGGFMMCIYIYIYLNICIFKNRSSTKIQRSDHSSESNSGPTIVFHQHLVPNNLTCFLNLLSACLATQR